MLINLDPAYDPAEAQRALVELGLWVRPLRDESGSVRSLEIIDRSPFIDRGALMALPGIKDVLVTKSAHPLIDAQSEATVTIRGVHFGGDLPVLLAGPCGADSEAAVHEIAALAARCGATFLRGGAYKPRTSPYAFSGHGHRALKWLRAAADENGLGVVTEVLSEHDVDDVGAAADIIQIGSRNMQNFALLRMVGALGAPVLLKRGRAATVEEWLLAGEHLLFAGAESVIFCERGVRGFDPQFRNLLDLASVALLKHGYGQPVLVDPSHSVGRRDLVDHMSRAAVAAGADGVMVEVNPNPGSALSDGPQAIGEKTLSVLAEALGLPGRG